MATGRIRVWPVRLAALALVGGMLGLLTWQSDLPYWPWAAACAGSSFLVCVVHGLVVQRRERRWNDRVVAAYRTGNFDVPPPPRGSVAVLAAALGLALAGGVLVVLGLVERFG